MHPDIQAISSRPNMDCLQREFRPKGQQQPIKDHESELAKTYDQLYTFTKIKTEPQDSTGLNLQEGTHPEPSMNLPERPSRSTFIDDSTCLYDACYKLEGRQSQPSMDLSLRPHRSAFTSDNTYDALYKQANLSEANYGLGRRRRAKTMHRLASSASKEESDEMVTTFSSSANELIG